MASCPFAKAHEKPHKNVIFQSPVANIYFVIGCKKSAGMVSRLPRSNVVTSLFLDAIASLEPGLVTHSLSHSRIEIISQPYPRILD